MDPSQLKGKIDAHLPGAALEVAPFGRSPLSGSSTVSWASLWVKGEALKKVATFIKNDKENNISHFENFSVVQLSEALVLNYFLRSLVNDGGIVLRASFVLGGSGDQDHGPETKVEVPSLCEIWPSLSHYEQEASELFGLTFAETEKSEDAEKRKNYVFAPDFNQFPLRKDGQSSP